MQPPGVLMVAEKPSIAETLANILSGGTSKKRRGVSPVTSVWEFPGTFAQEKVLFKVTSTAGHIYQTDFPGHFNSWEKVNPIELFDAPVIKTEANPKHRLPAHLHKEAVGCKHLVLWLDCDREGENICFEVIGIVAPALAKVLHGQQQIWRAKFSALAAPDIHKAMNSLGSPNKNESDSVDARQELDLKVGCAFTRFQTQYFQGKYGDLDSSLISYGPCQTPTLQFCVRRYDDIQSFQPETYYTVQVEARVGEQQLYLQWEHGQVFDASVAQAFKEIISFGSPVAEVLSVTEKEDCLPRPLALNTVNMLKLASQALGMGPHQAMQTAERLYLAGVITYPRTETTKYPASFDLRAAVAAQASHRSWGAYACDLLNVTGLARPRDGFDAGDHPPITPVRAATEETLGGGDAWRLYELITRHFLASVSHDCRFTKLSVTFEINGELFFASGRKVLDPGFTRIMRAAALQDVALPDFRPGDRVPVQKVVLQSSQTNPPPLLSEADLLGQMEKHCIGTDASMATHINNICDRNYVTLVGSRRLEPTKLGVALVHGYMTIDPELVLPSVRASIEALVDVIAKGEAEMVPVVAHSLHMFKLKFAYFLQQIEKMDLLFEATFTILSQTGTALSRCGKCNRYMNLITKRPTRLHCRTCNITYNMPQNGTIKLYKELKCPLDNFELVLFTQKGGKTYPLCPLCYNDPPFEETTTKHMSCVECPHPTCKHSVEAVGVLQCPQPDCKGIMYLDVVSGPKWKLECNTCQYQAKLMEGAHRISVTSDECETCGSMILHVVMNKNKPFKDGQLEKTACFICDPELHPLVESSFARTFRPRRSRGGRGRGRGRGRGGARGRENADPRMTFDLF